MNWSVWLTFWHNWRRQQQQQKRNIEGCASQKLRSLKKPYKCTYCDVCFARDGSLKMHVNTVHEKKKSNVCENCGASFSRKSHLTRHIDAIHEKKKPNLWCFFSIKSSINKDISKSHLSSMWTNYRLSLHSKFSSVPNKHRPTLIGFRSMFLFKTSKSSLIW